MDTETVLEEREVYEPPVLVEVGRFAEETRGFGFWRPEGWGQGTWS